VKGPVDGAEIRPPGRPLGHHRCVFRKYL